MAGAWTAALPYAVLAGLALALIRPGYLRRERPGLALGQRLGVVLTAAPLFLLVIVGLTSLPRLVQGGAPAAVSSQVLAGKAVLHLLLYLAVPLVGLLLIYGLPGLRRRARRALTGDASPLVGLSKGLPRAAALSVFLVAGVLLGWSALSDQAGLFSAEGPRVFFSNTTPAVALVLAGVAAVAEELLFRGVLLGHLKRYTPLHAAVGLQAVLFGLIHAGYGSLIHVAAATGFGLLMGYLAHHHGLVPAMLVHFVVNLAVLAAWSEQAALLGAAIMLLASLVCTAWLLQDRTTLARAAPSDEADATAQ